MLLNRFLIILVIVILLPGCYKKGTDETPQDTLIENPEYLNRNIKELTGSESKFILKGKFVSDSINELSSGIEIVNKKEWGIKFFLFTLKNGKIEKKYESALLNGSFKESKVEKLKIPNTDHELIYYNSMNYFMGSGSGEVLAYIIDFKSQITYYAHLVSEPEGKIELFMSQQDNSDISKYFISVFKKDYPTLRLTSKDPVLD